MNDKIDINDLEWVAGVADDLDEIADELKEANKLLKELDDYLEDNNFKKEINFGFVDQSRDLNKIKDNVQIIRRAAKSTESSYGYTADMSIAGLVDLCIDQPFHRRMEKTVARLAKADISNYTAENAGGIVVEEETWEAGVSINSPSTRVVKLVTPKRLTINDILSSPFSKSMRKKQYQEYLKLLYPDLSDKGIEAIDTKLLYDMYLKSQLDMADFDYLTQIEEGLNGLRKLGLGLGLMTIAIVLSPATAALLGTGATVITVSSTAVNGFLSIVDVISLISGKDINGNELTKAERDSLLASVVIDGAFLAGSVYSKIQLRGANSAINVNKILRQSACSNEDLYKYLKNIDAGLADDFLKNGVWPSDIQIPKNPSVLNTDGAIDWNQVPSGGYVLDANGKPIKRVYTPEVGDVIDRYGSPNGTYVSPVIDGKPVKYENRSLPFVEDMKQYHQYKITGDFNNIQSYIENCTDSALKAEVQAAVLKYYGGDYNKLTTSIGNIAPGFGTIKGATQIQFPLTASQLERLGLIREIK